MSFIPEIEQRPLQEQDAFQYRQLKKLLLYLQQKSPFYQRLFQDRHINISDVKSLDDLTTLPVTEKQDLQLHNWDFLCVPRTAVCEYTTTSGTLGNPVTIALTREDLKRLAYNEFLSFHSMEITEKDTVQLMLTLDRQFMAGMAYYSGLQQIGAGAVRTGPGQPALQWETISRLGTTALVAVPSFLLQLMAHAPAGQPVNTFPVKKVLAIGESLKTENGIPNALARSITEQWNIQLFGTYAATEMQTAFTECTAGCGGHHHPELIILELLDDNNRPVAAGEKGEVTITTLGVEGMPLLRYKTGDICRSYRAPCRCGRQTVRLGPVLGRKQQMIKYKGTTFYPPALFNILQEIPWIDEYCIQLDKDAFGKDNLTLLIQDSDRKEEIHAAVQSACRHKLRVIPEIRFLPEAEIRALQFRGASRKQQRMLDLRTP